MPLEILLVEDNEGDARRCESFCWKLTRMSVFMSFLME
jgi:hypothetical protein